MSLVPARFRYWLRLARAQGIARRYFVVNGFDGALTTLGVLMGFYAADETPVGVVLSACLGAAIALGMSGLTSAYIAETSERRRALMELERAMAMDLSGTPHGDAARVVPVLISLINGLAPFSLAVVIISPLALARVGLLSGNAAIPAAIGLAFCCLFLLGVYLGRVSGRFWLWSGLQTVTVAIFTALLVYWFTS
ncbi:MAG: hypothetical protein SVU69_00595 [Pseudomonadota bacterium]|nr:hypothetical protein [Pseudomonadota bacterium]